MREKLLSLLRNLSLASHKSHFLFFVGSRQTLNGEVLVKFVHEYVLRRKHADQWVGMKLQDFQYSGIVQLLLTGWKGHEEQSGNLPHVMRSNLSACRLTAYTDEFAGIFVQQVHFYLWSAILYILYVRVHCWCLYSRGKKVMRRKNHNHHKITPVVVDLRSKVNLSIVTL